MELEPRELATYLQVLREAGVDEFKCANFSVKLYPTAHVEQILPERNKPAPQRSLFQDPKLWPGGVPPKFPTSE